MLLPSTQRELNLKERFSVTITDEELADFSSKALYAEYYSVKSNGGLVDSINRNILCNSPVELLMTISDAKKLII